MKYLSSLLVLLLFGGSILFSQDRLVVPSVNPVLLKNLGPKEVLFSQEKINVQEDSVIYQYDTLSLPFIDDFTTDHLPKRLEDINAASVRDTTVYKIYLGGSIYSGNGLVRDTTFYYQIGTDSSILQKTELFIGIADTHNIQQYPTFSNIVNIYAPYNIYDTVGSSPDTVPVQPTLFQDSANYYFVKAGSNAFYTDRSVLINQTFAIDPPSYGVATFDGLNEFGLPYQIDQQLTVKADYLTSVPIDLSFPSDTVYFSFYFEPKGLSLDPPETGDSLILEFFNANSQAWVKVWETPGFIADTFRQVMQRVDTSFYSSAFQFRFRNYASSAGAYDQWHIDYLYLNDQRQKGDTTSKDLTFMDPGPSLLADYTAMPWWHFKPNPAAFMTDSFRNLRVQNLHDGGLNVFNKVSIRDTVNNTLFYRFPANDQFSIIAPRRRLTFDYPINFDFPSNYIDTAGTLEALVDVDFRPPASQDPDFIRANDSIVGKAILQDYYAYDDGTAEAGYGVNAGSSSGGLFTYMAVEYNMPIADTIGGVQIYFLPQRVSTDYPVITKQTFELTIWSSLNPTQIVYQKQDRFNPMFSDDNGFITFWLDTLIPVNQTFYVGLKVIGPLSLNIGYDLNTNHRDKVFYSTNGTSWSNPSPGIFDGSLMLRPVFRKKNWGVGIPVLNKAQPKLVVYPNPATDYLRIKVSPYERVSEYQLFDLSGRLMLSGSYQGEDLNISHLNKGVYILKVQTESGIFNRKILLSR